MAAYSPLALLLGGTLPEPPHSEFDTLLPSPRSVSAMMLRVFDVVPVLFVTQISTRVMLMPLSTLGRCDMLSSYRSRKKWERKKWRFSS